MERPVQGQGAGVVSWTLRSVNSWELYSLLKSSKKLLPKNANAKSHTEFK